MTFYRCFAIDSEGHVRGAEVLDCADDAAAAVAAQSLLALHPAARRLEIWQFDRRVAVLTPQRRNAA